MVEHSLHKNFLRLLSGDPRSIQRSGFFRRNNSQYMSDTDLWKTGSLMQTISERKEKSCCQVTFHLGKRERSPIKLVLWRHLECGMMSNLLYYAILLHNSSNLYPVSASQINLWRITRRWLDEAKSIEGPRAGRRTIGQVRRTWDTPWNRGCPGCLDLVWVSF